jgi:hypothetical protein
VAFLLDQVVNVGRLSDLHFAWSDRIASLAFGLDPRYDFRTAISLDLIPYKEKVGGSSPPLPTEGPSLLGAASAALGSAA